MSRQPSDSSRKCVPKVPHVGEFLSVLDWKERSRRVSPSSRAMITPRTLLRLSQIIKAVAMVPEKSVPEEAKA